MIPFEDVLKMSWKCPEDVLRTYDQDEHIRLDQDVLKTKTKEVFIKTNVCWDLFWIGHDIYSKPYILLFLNVQEISIWKRCLSALDYLNKTAVATALEFLLIPWFIKYVTWHIQEKVIKYYITLLPWLSHIYWLIHFIDSKQQRMIWRVWHLGNGFL